MIFRALIPLVAALLSIPGAADAGNNPAPLLAITDLRTVGLSSKAEANAFSEFIRKEIERTGLYRVISRSSMLSILKARDFPLPCHELNCFASMGKLLGANQVLAGNLQHSEDRFEVTLRLIDVENHRFIGTAYETAPSMDTGRLFGEWGRTAIRRVFGLSPEELPPPGEEESAETAEPAIPESILNKHPGMIYIPAGNVILGSMDGDPWERPPHDVFVNAFYINQYEVTNGEYARFVEETGHRPPPHWPGGLVPGGLENHPVMYVSFEDAEAYCEWAGGRLPTEAEWERAAKADTARAYPWGNEFDKDLANTWEAGRGGSAPVGSYFRGGSPFGVEDLSGNAFEWVQGFFAPYPGSKFRSAQFDQHLRVLRGGSWTFNAYYARVSHRFARSGGERGASYGIRPARDG